jgi:hypothetical protein
MISAKRIDRLNLPGLSDVVTSQLQSPILDEAFLDDIWKSCRQFAADAVESEKA